MKKLILILTIISAYVNAQTNYKNADSPTFKSMIEKKDGVVIDLRTNEECAKGIIKGAIQVDFLGKEFEMVMQKMDKSKKYYVYCQGGGRSAEAAEWMTKNGFKNVVNLEKGYFDWSRKGYPTEIQK